MRHQIRKSTCKAAGKEKNCMQTLLSPVFFYSTGDK